MKAAWAISSRAEIVSVHSSMILAVDGRTAQGTKLEAGSYRVIPGKSPHWAIAKDDLLFTVTLEKPADFHACEQAKWRSKNGRPARLTPRAGSP